MYRFALALAFLFAAGRSPAASPDPASLEPTPELQVKARALVRQLGSEGYEEREEAQKQLAALGRLARPALLHGASASPSAEVRLRCTELLPAASALDLRARVECFLADSEGRYEHDLPGWKTFRATACGEWSFGGQVLWSDRERRQAAREVFAALLASPDNRRIVTAADGSRLELSELAVARRLDLSRRRTRGEDDDTRAPKLEDVTALLFAESLTGAQSFPRRGSVSFLLSSSGFYSAARGAEPKARVYRAVAAAWLDSRTEPREMYQALGVATNLELTDQSCAIAARLLATPGVMAAYRGRAAAHLIDYGGKRHVTLLEPALAHAQVIYSFRTTTLTEGGPEDATREIQVRDLALAVSAVLAGKKPEDLGFADRFDSAKESDYPSFVYSRYYFPDDEARKRAFAKWAEWRKASARE